MGQVEADAARAPKGGQGCHHGGDRRARRGLLRRAQRPASGAQRAAQLPEIQRVGDGVSIGADHGRGIVLRTRGRHVKPVPGLSDSAADAAAMGPGDAAADGTLNRKFKAGFPVGLQAFRHADMLNGPE